MTVTETILFVRLVLDDGLPERWSPDDVDRALTRAQLDQVARAAAAGDERCLRTLHTDLPGLAPGDIVADCLYARAAVLRRSGDPAFLDQTLTHSSWHRLTHTPGDASAVPGGGWFSVDTERRVRFVAGPGMELLLHYIREPQPFGAAAALELPEEYHPEVALAAAAFLASGDEEEQETRLVQALEGGLW